MAMIHYDANLKRSKSGDPRDEEQTEVFWICSSFLRVRLTSLAWVNEGKNTCKLHLLIVQSLQMNRHHAYEK